MAAYRCPWIPEQWGFKKKQAYPGWNPTSLIPPEKISIQLCTPSLQNKQNNQLLFLPMLEMGSPNFFF